MKQTDVSPAHLIFFLRGPQTLKRLRLAEKLRVNVTSKLNQQALIQENEKNDDTTTTTRTKLSSSSSIDDESNNGGDFGVEEITF
jgi:hypothetical protein